MMENNNRTSSSSALPNRGVSDHLTGDSMRGDEEWMTKASYCMPSLLDTGTTDNNDASSKLKQKQQRRQNRRQQCVTTFDIIKRICIYIVAVAAITSSVVSIYSCNFFSYKEITVVSTDGFTISIENDNVNRFDLGYQYTPFEFLNEAGVGLFAYYMGDPFFRSTATILYKQEPMCFLYCDELHTFHWFYNNYNPDNKGLLTRKIDLWIVARYCSIIAPIVALFGLIQLLVVENWFCRWHCRINTKLASSCLLFGTFLSASLIQFGTFSIMFASPNLSSPSQSDGTTYQDSFCFTSTSAYLCRIDTGAFYSLGSGLVYLVLAFYSYNKICTTQRSDNTDDNDDNDNASRTPSSSSSKKKLATDPEKSDTSDSSSDNDDNDDDIEQIGKWKNKQILTANTLVESSKSKNQKSNDYYNIKQRASRLLAASFNPCVSKSKSLHDHHDDYLENDTRNTIINVLTEMKRPSSSSSSSDLDDIVQEELDNYDTNDIYAITDNDKDKDKDNNNAMVKKTFLDNFKCFVLQL